MDPEDIALGLMSKFFHHMKRQAGTTMIDIDNLTENFRVLWVILPG